MKIAIVDDEEMYVNEISGLIYQCDKEHTIETYASGEEFLQAKIYDYNIVFLDIEIGNMNGVEIGQRLREKGSEALIFYVTNHVAYISEALRNAPYQYFIKPIRRDIFIKDFNNAVDKVVKSCRYIKLIWKGEQSSIVIGQIVYIEYEARRLHFHSYNKDDKLSLGRIADMQKKLNNYDFVTCHKSFMVNMKYIAEINKIDITMIDGSVVPMSKACRTNVKDKYNFYLARVTI